MVNLQLGNAIYTFITKGPVYTITLFTITVQYPQWRRLWMRQVDTDTPWQNARYAKMAECNDLAHRTRAVL